MDNTGVHEQECFSISQPSDSLVVINVGIRMNWGPGDLVDLFSNWTMFTYYIIYRSRMIKRRTSLVRSVLLKAKSAAKRKGSLVA